MKGLSTEEVLDRIEIAFGARPTSNAIHLAVSRARGTEIAYTSWRSSLTSGLPVPREEGDRLVFDQEQVEEWIRTHPARAGERLEEELVADETAEERAAAVSRARAEGLSWVKIAEAIASIDGRPVSRELVRKVFTPLIQSR